MFEGGTTYYKVVMLDSDGNQINAEGTVDIRFLDHSAVHTGDLANGMKDFSAHSMTVELNTVFSVHASNDMVVEGCEQFRCGDRGWFFLKCSCLQCCQL